LTSDATAVYPAPIIIELDVILAEYFRINQLGWIFSRVGQAMHAGRDVVFLDETDIFAGR
jgi:hypothetical protein